MTTTILLVILWAVVFVFTLALLSAAKRGDEPIPLSDFRYMGIPIGSMVKEGLEDKQRKQRMDHLRAMVRPPVVCVDDNLKMKDAMLIALRGVFENILSKAESDAALRNARAGADMIDIALTKYPPLPVYSNNVVRINKKV